MERPITPPANTPTFDRLAARGLSFNNFHTTAVCAASRAAVLTGRNSHNVAMGGVPEISTGFPGYNSSIPRSAATVLEILHHNGYARPGSVRPTSPPFMRSPLPARSTGGRGVWAPTTSTAFSDRA
jgi:Sulfatase